MERHQQEFDRFSEEVRLAKKSQMRSEQGRFTDEMRLVFQNSQAEVTSFRHNYVGTEHLLLGILRGEPEDPSVVALNKAGVDLNTIRSAVEFIVGRGDPKMKIHSDIGLTPRSKMAIKIAAGDPSDTKPITTSDLLKGILQSGPSMAISILGSININLDELASSIGTNINQEVQPAITEEEFEKMLAENIQKEKEAKLIKKGEKLESLEYRDRNSVDSLISFLSDTDITRADKDFVNDILSKIVWRVQK